MHEKLLDAARVFAGERVAEEEAQVQAIHESTRDLSNKERLLHRVTHLRAVTAWADNLWASLSADADERHRGRLQEALQLAHKVLADREDKATDKSVSVQDPDARTGMHGGYFTGYYLDVAADADSEIITTINVLPGNGNEAADATHLIEHEEQTHGNDVQQLSIDSAGCRGSLLREWTGGRLQLDVIVPVPAEKPRTVFGPDAFTLDAKGETLTCPAGQTTKRRTRSKHDTGYKYVFAQTKCAACPLHNQCMDHPVGKIGRSVTKNDYEAEYKAARAKVDSVRRLRTSLAA